MSLRLLLSSLPFWIWITLWYFVYFIKIYEEKSLSIFTIHSFTSKMWCESAAHEMFHQKQCVGRKKWIFHVNIAWFCTKCHIDINDLALTNITTSWKIYEYVDINTTSSTIPPFNNIYFVEDRTLITMFMKQFKNEIYNNINHPFVTRVIDLLLKKSHDVFLWSTFFPMIDCNIPPQK